jgi:serine protease Do
MILPLFALALYLCTFLAHADPLAPLAEPSASARDLFAANKERLLQVRVLLASAGEQSSLGSGFLVEDRASKLPLVVTNYHVVSSLAMEPKKYRIELRGTNGRTVPAQLMALDVVHDLAILRIQPTTPNDTAWLSFPLRNETLPQGAKVFALGNPLELGFLISEGIYNGLVESRIYEQMLFSGAINSGMSGGPAIDESSRVVGVNVATRRDGQALSFLVPVQYVRELLTKAQQATKGSPRIEWRSEIAQQLQAHQNFVATTVLRSKAGFSSQTLSGRRVPTLNGNLTKCWARGADSDSVRFQSDSLECQLHSDLFVKQGFYTGSLHLKHELTRNEKLTTVQFLNMADRRFSIDRPTRSGRELSHRKCHGSYVQGSAHVYRVAVCVEAYRKFDNLYKFHLTALQVDDPRERLQSSIVLDGFSFANAHRIGTEFLGLLQ